MIEGIQEEFDTRPAKRMRLATSLDGEVDATSSSTRDEMSLPGLNTDSAHEQFSTAQMTQDLPTMVTPPPTSDPVEADAVTSARVQPSPVEHELADCGKSVSNLPTSLPLPSATAAANGGDVGGVSVISSEQQEVDHANSDDVIMNGLEELLAPRSETALITKSTGDAEFQAAAEAQKGNPEAEWEEDSSSDMSDTSEDDAEEESDNESDIEPMDPDELASFLMKEGGEEDGDKKKDAADHQPRTLNEKKEEYPGKPNVEITLDMKSVLLGKVDNLVGKTLLVKGLPADGEQFVLDIGSVLCNENREVIGQIGDVLGQTREPFYIVSIDSKDVEELGLESGANVYYVDKLSNKVFTKPLTAMKGTDASNIHDEEVGEDEQEFSDDEEEAASKRDKKAEKLAKKLGNASRPRDRKPARGRGGRGGTTISCPGPSGPSWYINKDPRGSAGGADPLNYDDDDEGYTVLQRPDDIMEAPPPSGPPMNRGGYRGEGRGPHGGDRGRGGRGGRGGNDRNDRRGPRGNDRGGPRDDYRGDSRGNSRPGSRDGPNGRPSNGVPVAPPPFPPPMPPAQHGYQVPGQQQQYPPQNYTFNGNNYQYHQTPQQYPPWPNHQAQQSQAAPAYQPQQGYYQQQPAHPAPGSYPGSYGQQPYYTQQAPQQTPAYSHAQQQYAYGQQQQYSGGYQAPAAQAQPGAPNVANIGAYLQQLQRGPQPPPQ